MALASILLSLLVAGGSVTPAARIVAEWDPGIAEIELGGALVVDTYGVSGLGAYQVRLDDGTTVAAVCIEADIGHSLAADYSVDAAVSLGAELDYLLWAYLGPGGTATDEEAAAVNALVWRYRDARRRTGGPVWQGEELEIRVLGVGRLTAVEQAVAALGAEATARRGPWALGAIEVVDGVVTTRLTGPGGPIAGVDVRFEADHGWEATASTDADGVAAVPLPVAVAAVRAMASGPGAGWTLVAPGSQRLATAGPAVVVSTALVVPTTSSPPANSTTSTTSTTSSTSTTSTTSSTTPATTSTVAETMTAPPASSTSTTSPGTSSPPATTSSASTTSTVAAATTTPAGTTTTGPPPATPTTSRPSPPTPPTPPPTLPRTGAAVSGLGRVAALLFTPGALAVLVATPRRRSS